MMITTRMLPTRQLFAYLARKNRTTTPTNSAAKGIRRMMNAAVYHEFGGPIRVEPMVRPVCPNDGVVIRVRAAGVCRSDWHGWKGHDSDIVQQGLPWIPGHEVSGIVVEIGSELLPTSVFRIGDRVAVPFILSCGQCEFCQCDRSTVCLDQKQPGFTQHGGFAEFLAVPRAERNLSQIPVNVSFQQAAALGCRFTTAYRAVLQQGRLQANESVAIFGCGGLGLSCILLAVAQGCTTIVAVDVSARALQKAVELGATHAVQTSRSSSDDEKNDATSVRQQVHDITNGGADLTVEASGVAWACENAIWCTRRAGRMVQVGLIAAKKRTLSVPMDLVVAREMEIIGSHGFAANDLPALLHMVASRKLDPSVLIEREVTLEEGARAMEAMDHGSPLGITMITQFTTHETTTTTASRL